MYCQLWVLYMYCEAYLWHLRSRECQHWTQASRHWASASNKDAVLPLGGGGKQHCQVVVELVRAEGGQNHVREVEDGACKGAAIEAAFATVS